MRGDGAGLERRRWRPAASAQRSSNMPSTSTAASNGRLGHADRGAGVPAGLAQHRHHQVRGTVDHLGMVGEMRRAGDEAAQAQAGDDALQIAAGGLDLGQDVDGAQPCRRLAVLQADAAAELALVLERTRLHRQLAGDHEQVAAAAGRDVVGSRRRRGRAARSRAPASGRRRCPPCGSPRGIDRRTGKIGQAQTSGRLELQLTGPCVGVPIFRDGTVARGSTGLGGSFSSGQLNRPCSADADQFPLLFPLSSATPAQGKAAP